MTKLYSNRIHDLTDYGMVSQFISLSSETLINYSHKVDKALLVFSFKSVEIIESSGQPVLLFALVIAPPIRKFLALWGAELVFHSNNMNCGRCFCLWGWDDWFRISSSWGRRVDNKIDLLSREPLSVELDSRDQANRNCVSSKQLYIYMCM